MFRSGRVLQLVGGWSWVPDERGASRWVEQVHVLRRGTAAVALLAVPMPFRGNDSEHGETALRWTPVLLGGYLALGLSGAADPLEASVIAWLTPFGQSEWQLMRGTRLPDLGLRDGTLVRLPDVPGAAVRWPRSAS
jgi:hypothetical protein